MRIAILCAAASLACAAPARAEPPPPLEAEDSDVATLPAPTAHRVWLIELYSGQTQIVDGDTGSLLGSIYGASLSNYAGAPGQGAIYVAESVWSKGNRGTRQDLVAVYDGASLDLLTEIALPGRIYQAPITHNFVLGADGRRGYVYNMQPAASVVVLDLERRRVLRSVDVPGCAMAYPFGADGFASLCGDGSLATVAHADDATRIVRGTPFFDAENDPVFDDSPSDPATGKSLFVTFSGMVHPVLLTEAPEFGPAWSLQEAAGLDRAGIGDGSLAWRPGGRRPMTLHRATGHLYVLMHPGEPWSHKEMGTELWVVDAEKHAVLRRMKLETPVNAIAVSQDGKPLLYMVDKKLTLSIRDADTLAEVRKIDDVRGVVPYVPER